MKKKNAIIIGGVSVIITVLMGTVILIRKTLQDIDNLHFANLID